jgi:hypothetical protein
MLLTCQAADGFSIPAKDVGFGESASIGAAIFKSTNRVEDDHVGAADV